VSPPERRVPGWTGTYPYPYPSGEERTARAQQARAALRAWNGYDPSAGEQAELDAE
jgi:hypothetical protein